MRLERAATGRADLLPHNGSRCALGFEGKYPGRVRPRRQAPSLTGHHMLPRTTQQSHSAVRHGERVSDRTMVGHDHPCGWCSLSRRTGQRRGVKTIHHLPPPRPCQYQPGLDARELPPSLPPEVKYFLLTSPSIEPVRHRLTHPDLERHETRGTPLC
jgi:hypothetical protein